MNLCHLHPWLSPLCRLESDGCKVSYCLTNGLIIRSKQRILNVYKVSCFMEYLRCLIDCIYFLQDRGIKPDIQLVFQCWLSSIRCLTSALVGRERSMACLWWSRKWCGGPQLSGWYLVSIISSRGVIIDTGPERDGELVLPSWNKENCVNILQLVK